MWLDSLKYWVQISSNEYLNLESIICSIPKEHYDQMWKEYRDYEEEQQRLAGPMGLYRSRNVPTVQSNDEIFKRVEDGRAIILDIRDLIFNQSLDLDDMSVKVKALNTDGTWRDISLGELDPEFLPFLKTEVDRYRDFFAQAAIHWAGQDFKSKYKY
jgi:hypothetical protein